MIACLYSALVCRKSAGKVGFLGFDKSAMLTALSSNPRDEKKLAQTLPASWLAASIASNNKVLS